MIKSKKKTILWLKQWIKFSVRELKENNFDDSCSKPKFWRRTWRKQNQRTKTVDLVAHTWFFQFILKSSWTKLASNEKKTEKTRIWHAAGQKMTRKWHKTHFLAGPVRALGRQWENDKFCKWRPFRPTETQSHLDFVIGPVRAPRSQWHGRLKCCASKKPKSFGLCDWWNISIPHAIGFLRPLGSQSQSPNDFDFWLA